jgi:hypothetical protein
MEQPKNWRLGGFLIWKMCVTLIFGTWIIKATSEQGSRGNDVNLEDCIPRKKGKSTRKKMWRRT